MHAFVPTNVRFEVVDLCLATRVGKIGYHQAAADVIISKLSTMLDLGIGMSSLGGNTALVLCLTHLDAEAMAVKIRLALDKGQFNCGRVEHAHRDCMSTLSEYISGTGPSL
jgi:hypothetical protein